MIQDSRWLTLTMCRVPVTGNLALRLTRQPRQVGVACRRRARPHRRARSTGCDVCSRGQTESETPATASTSFLEAEPGRILRQPSCQADPTDEATAASPPPHPHRLMLSLGVGVGPAPLRGRRKLPRNLTPAQGEATGGGGPRAGQAMDVNPFSPSTAGATSTAPDKTGATLPPPPPLSLPDDEWLPPPPFRPPEESP